MVYKNIFSRIFISSLLIIIYLLSVYNHDLLFFIVTFFYLIIFYETFINFKKFNRYIYIYLTISYLCFFLYFIYFFDYKLLNLMVISIIIFDSLSYFTGIVFGKNYIFKKISPKKTLEGYLGGIFITNLISLIFFYYNFYYFDHISVLIFINSIIFFSICGDLLQSFFKRKNNIKDSSNFLPGHGGFFDRFDSFISSIIFLTIYTSL